MKGGFQRWSHAPGGAIERGRERVAAGGGTHLSTDLNQYMAAFVRHCEVMQTSHMQVCVFVRACVSEGVKEGRPPVPETKAGDAFARLNIHELY